jgi:hypothetical protein
VRFFAGPLQGHDFGVRPAGSFVPAFADDFVFSG